MLTARRSRHLPRLLAASLAAGVLLAPAAQARPAADVAFDPTDSGVALSATEPSAVVYPRDSGIGLSATEPSAVVYPRDSGIATGAVEPGTTVIIAPVAAPAPTPSSSLPAVVQSIDDGFDWGAAAIGAGAVAGLALLGLGGMTTRHRLHTRMHPAG